MSFVLTSWSCRSWAAWRWTFSRDSSRKTRWYGWCPIHRCWWEKGLRESPQEKMRSRGIVTLSKSCLIWWGSPTCCPSVWLTRSPASAAVGLRLRIWWSKRWQTAVWKTACPGRWQFSSPLKRLQALLKWSYRPDVIPPHSRTASARLAAARLPACTRSRMAGSALQRSMRLPKAASEW